MTTILSITTLMLYATLIIALNIKKSKQSKRKKLVMNLVAISVAIGITAGAKNIIEPKTLSIIHWEETISLLPSLSPKAIVILIVEALSIAISAAYLIAALGAISWAIFRSRMWLIIGITLGLILGSTSWVILESIPWAILELILGMTLTSVVGINETEILSKEDFS